jgi:beta-N-acetylhexosaminidase
MVDVAGPELEPEDRDILEHELVGSVILFARNCREPEQIAALVKDIHGLRSPPLLVAVDQEGGRVQRMREGFTVLPPLHSLGRRYDVDRREALDLARTAAWLMAIEVRSVGVDFSFAPCVDLDHGVSEVIGDRAFHADGEAVAALAVAYLTGMREAGMAGVAKHFPGHGAVIADSHVSLPVDRRRFADLDDDLHPYRLLIENHVAGIMAAHVVFPDVDALPASLSRRWITGVLREELHFHGCVFSDDIVMRGIDAFGDVAARAQRALDAGCDVLPVCNDRKAVHRVLDSIKSREADPASAARLVRMRARHAPPADMGGSAAWRHAVAKVNSLNAAPPFVLTEGRA